MEQIQNYSLENNRPQPKQPSSTHNGFRTKPSALYLTKKGLGIRVLATDHEECLRQLRPDDAEDFLGTMWELNQLPPTWGPSALQHFVGDWKFTVIRRFVKGWRNNRRQTFIVRAQTHPFAPLHDTISGSVSFNRQFPNQPRKSKSKSGQTKTWSVADFPALGGGPAPKRSFKEATWTRPSISPQPLGGPNIEALVAAAVAQAIAPLRQQISALQLAPNADAVSVPSDAEADEMDTERNGPEDKKSSNLSVILAACTTMKPCAL